MKSYKSLLKESIAEFDSSDKAEGDRMGKKVVYRTDDPNYKEAYKQYKHTGQDPSENIKVIFKYLKKIVFGFLCFLGAVSLLVAIIVSMIGPDYTNESESDSGKVTLQSKESNSSRSKYRSSWSEDCGPFVPMARNLVNRGCPEFYCKQRTDGSSEYLVKCIGSGDVVRYYIVWPNIDNVMGPYYDAGELE